MAALIGSLLHYIIHADLIGKIIAAAATGTVLVFVVKIIRHGPNGLLVLIGGLIAIFAKDPSRCLAVRAKDVLETLVTGKRSPHPDSPAPPPEKRRLRRRVKVPTAPGGQEADSDIDQASD